MTALSDRFDSLANRLTARYGQSVTFTRIDEGAYVPSTGATGTAIESSYTVNVVPDDYNTFERSLEHIQQGDVKITMPNPSTLPLEGDTVVFNSVTYRVMSVVRCTVNAVDVLYELQLRV